MLTFLKRLMKKHNLLRLKFENKTNKSMEIKQAQTTQHSRMIKTKINCFSRSLQYIEFHVVLLTFRVKKPFY